MRVSARILVQQLPLMRYHANLQLHGTQTVTRKAYLKKPAQAQDIRTIPRMNSSQILAGTKKMHL